MSCCDFCTDACPIFYYPVASHKESEAVELPFDGWSACGDCSDLIELGSLEVWGDKLWERLADRMSQAGLVTDKWHKALTLEEWATFEKFSTRPRQLTPGALMFV